MTSQGNPSPFPPESGVEAGLELSQSMDISELRAALAEQIRENEGLRSAIVLQSPAMPDPMPAAPCRLLQLPPELRNKIYGFLLISEYFSTPQSLEQKTYVNSLPGSKPTTKRSSEDTYGISISVLYACRQLYHEASIILYGSNTFYFNCITDNHEDRRITHLTRGFNNEYFETSTGKARLHAMKRIKHWKVVISNYRDRYNSAQPYQGDVLRFFCKEIRNCQVTSVHVIVVPMGLQSFDTLTEKEEFKSHPLEDVWWPFLMLQNIDRFEITVAKHEELPHWETRHWSLAVCGPPESRPKLPVEVLSIYFQELMERSLQSGIVLDMYENLLRYAKAFERCELFKKEMHLGTWGMAKEIQRCRLWYDDFDHFGPRPEGSCEFDQNFRSPFQQSMAHPVEDALNQANAATEDNNLDAFRVHRKAVLEYLEPQYQRIIGASISLIEFIKAEKSKNGVFDVIAPKNHFNSKRFALGYILLENFAKSFNRDMPQLTACRIFLHQGIFDSHYESLPREMLLQQIRSWFRQITSDQNIINLFKRAVDDMETQYMEIREARKALFDCDYSLDFECDIDPEDWRCDETIDWGINEPDNPPGAMTESECVAKTKCMTVEEQQKVEEY